MARLKGIALDSFFTSAHGQKVKGDEFAGTATEMRELETAGLIEVTGEAPAAPGDPSEPSVSVTKVTPENKAIANAPENKTGEVADPEAAKQAAVDAKAEAAKTAEQKKADAKAAKDAANAAKAEKAKQDRIFKKA